MKRAFRVGTVALLAACGPHEDYTPLIHVDPNAARRIDMFASKRTPAVPTNPARVHAMKAGEELGGPNASGRAGDMIIENDEVTFVIDQLGSSSGFAESGGNIVDAADAKIRRDELGQVFTYFGAFPRQGVYETMTSGVLADGTAFIEARGRELYEKDLTIRTRYSLHASDRALLIETSIENKGKGLITLPGVGDAIQWGATTKFSPDRGRGFKGASKGAFLAGIGRAGSYAITSTDGTMEAQSGTSWSDTIQMRRTEIPAGKTVQYTRVFVVGPRPDISGLVAELTKSSGGAVGVITVALKDEAGQGVSSPDATVEVDDDAGHPIMDLAMDARSGKLSGELPPGNYRLRYLRGAGRGPRGVAQPVVVQANQEAQITLEAPARARSRSGAKSVRVARPWRLEAHAR